MHARVHMPEITTAEAGGSLLPAGTLFAMGSQVLHCTSWSSVFFKQQQEPQTCWAMQVASSFLVVSR